MSSEKTIFQKLQPHVGLLALAFGIWWLVNQSVKVEEPIENIVSLDVTLALDEQVADSWVVYDLPQTRYSLNVTGPRQEVNRFFDLVKIEDPSGKNAVFTAAIDERLFNKAEVDEATEQRHVKIPLSDFARQRPESISSEIHLDFVKEDAVVTVTLERVVDDTAKLHLGEVTKLPNFEASFDFPDTFKIKGPFSKFAGAEKMKTGGGIKLMLAPLDLSKITDPQVERKIRVPVELPPGLKLLREDEGEEIKEVDVHVRFKPQTTYIQVNDFFPVGVTRPRWMIDKGVQIEGLMEKYPVFLKVTPDSKPHFTRSKVHVNLDLSAIQEADLTIETNGNQHRAVVSSAYLRLTLDEEEHMSIRLNETQTLKRFYKHAAFTLVWEKAE